MSDPAYIPNSQIDISPEARNQVSSIRPNGEGLLIPVPTSFSSKKPQITVTLSKLEPVEFEKVQLFGNTRIATLEVKATNNDEFSKLEDFDHVAATEIMDMTQPLEVVAIRITLEEPVSENSRMPNNYNIRMKLYACFHGGTSQTQA